MRKRVAGGSFIVAATLLTYQHQEMIEEYQLLGNSIQDEG
ncbi:hypothetical protein BACCIP111895_01952 [Neobacillus rhizosphaerae]|uniref:Uncharacterized protein n=1 Tax=Neobacillus rhizosphaerae TaxID=2880965 RepID=A0ABN8KML9_9BACI|nr:hypothetical protein BACCIP111895_01952 [Neobacillus rhizosphaerae]